MTDRNAQIEAAFAAAHAATEALTAAGLEVEQGHMAFVAVAKASGQVYAISVDPKPQTLPDADAMFEAVGAMWDAIKRERERLAEASGAA